MKKFINSKDDLNRFLQIEREKYKIEYKGIPIFCIREKDFLWKHNILLRKSEYYTNTNKKLRSIIYRILLFRFQNKQQIHIPLNTFDCGLKLMHLGPILVNGNVICGKNISLHINTSIVAGGTNNETPQIGDGVVIGVGAVLLGGIKIANNIAVGANSVVNKSFYEENIAIAGVPAKKISNNGRLSWGKSN